MANNRLQALNRHLTEANIVDILIVGGGAIGLGIAYTILQK